MTILRGMAVPEFIGPEGYGVVTGALTMPTNVMRAAGPLMGAFAWSAFGNYTPVLWGLAAIMLVAAAGFAAAALSCRRAVAVADGVRTFAGTAPLRCAVQRQRAIYSAASFCALGLRCCTLGITSFDSSSSECRQACGLSA